MPNQVANKSLLLGFLLVIVAIVANTALTYFNLMRIHRNSEAVERQHKALDELRMLLTTLVDAETGQRGFLITEDEKFLAPYESAALQLEDKVASVKQLMSTDPERKKHFEELAAAIDLRMQSIRKSLEIQKTEGRDAVRATILQGSGKRAMDHVRTIIAAMEARERGELSVRTNESNTSFYLSLATGLATALLGLSLAVASYWLVGRDIEKRQQLSEALQKSKERLEERVQARTMEIEASNKALREEVTVRTKAELTAMTAAQELQRSNRELEQFASVASHDLQEPLRKIQAFGDRLQSNCGPQLGEKGLDFLQRILASAGRMRRLIDDLLTFSRVASKAQPFSAVDLNEIVDEIVGDLETRLQDAGGKFEIAKLPHIEADPSQMRQLFMNLLANALKFHRPGVAPMVRISSHNVAANGNGQLDGTRLPMQCEITVEDNGVGFEQEYAERIFELFQRLHGRDEYQGTGMGLAICRKIVERHAGSIAAFGKPGEGSRFVFRLPIQQNSTKQDLVA
ncbi:sensor histidine kinase [Anatilimnocola floriformis]|uniref:sensor histidine kinase n=1 Tax=Anatilimnocola floriformis TaxID=2948575 RepID=UPI0020C4D7ED|nr:sensor histidine kinase [Anatilimnocola floriformis]